MTIMITRLLTGEEILGDVSSSAPDGTVRVENPTNIQAMHNPKTGNLDVHVLPFMPLSSSKHIEIRSQHILCQYEPVVEVVNKYNKLFGSGLILPTNSGIQTID